MKAIRFLTYVILLSLPGTVFAQSHARCPPSPR